MQFAPETVGIETFGLFAPKVRRQFPGLERQPPLPPMSETFDQRPGLPSINVQFSDPASLPRLWLVSQSGEELVQLQHDRLSLNWRRVGTSTSYPRYKHLRNRVL